MFVHTQKRRKEMEDSSPLKYENKLNYLENLFSDFERKPPYVNEIEITC